MISTLTFRFAGSCVGSSCTSQLGSLVRQPQYSTKNSPASGASESCISPFNFRSWRDPAFDSIRLLERSLDASLICRLGGEAHKHFHTLSRQFYMVKGKSYGET